MESGSHQPQGVVPLTRRAAREAANAAFVLPDGTLTVPHLDESSPAPRLVRVHPPEPVVQAPPILVAPPVLARHARKRGVDKLRMGFAAAAASAFILGGSVVATTAAVGGETTPISTLASAVVAVEPPPALKSASIMVELESVIPAVVELSAPLIEAAPLGDDICASPEMTTALSIGDASGVLAAAGGVTKFREAVIAGTAACLSLSDPTYPWMVVNKQRSYNPIDYTPSLAWIDGIQNLAEAQLRWDAAGALAQLVAGATAAGVGDLGLLSGYRSYSTQQATYGDGGEEIEASVARPGFSEHQSGLAADVVACDYGSCGSLDDFGATAQGEWVAANAWQYGWIVRYEADTTGVTGYIPEPWHLRYIGVELAAEYHNAGWHSLEEFFGLPASPDYLG